MDTAPGGGRRGRPKKRWDDNIKEWTELPLAKTLRLVEDNDGRRKIARTSVVPLQPPTAKGRRRRRYAKSPLPPPPPPHTHTYIPPKPIIYSLTGRF